MITVTVDEVFFSKFEWHKQENFHRHSHNVHVLFRWLFGIIDLNKLRVLTKFSSFLFVTALHTQLLKEMRALLKLSVVTPLLTAVHCRKSSLCINLAIFNTSGHITRRISTTRLIIAVKVISKCVVVLKLIVKFGYQRTFCIQCSNVYSQNKLVSSVLIGYSSRREFTPLCFWERWTDTSPVCNRAF